MARGFYNTGYGVATTDSITVPFNAHSLNRTYSVWVWRNGGGGGGLGRIFDKRTNVVSTESELAFLENADLRYNRAWNTGQGGWRTSTNLVALFTWVHLAITYVASSVSVDPVLYVNGVLQAITEVGTPTGTTPTTTLANYVIGNRTNDNARGFDGLIADFAIYDTILSAGEITQLASGKRGNNIGVAPVCYVPLNGSSTTEVVSGNACTVSGTQVWPDPEGLDAYDATPGDKWYYIRRYI